MSDDEVIKFEITEHDLESEFNPRRGRRGTKEQQIYGMWAQDSEEEGSTEAVRPRSRRKKDFTAPIGFVAGGVQQTGKKNKQEIAAASEDGQRSVQAGNSSSSEEEQPAEEDTAGLRRRGLGRAPPLGGSVGNWEKHTKGIGAKLLLQMGYQPGKGLGKALQGISAPVEATVRKGRGAIGAYGPEKAAQKAKKEEEKRALKEKEEEDGPQKTYHWKKSHKGRYFYKDASDVIQEGRPTTIHTESSSVLSRVPVIDMTGRERRVLSGYAALHAQAPRFEHEPRRACRHFAAPELMHNVQLVVEGCEQDIISNARELQTAEDQSVTLEREVLELEKKVEEEETDLGAVGDILAAVEMLDDEDVSLDDAYRVFSKLKLRHPTEYESFGLGNVCESIISPMFARELADWEPLERPAEPVPLFMRWRDLLTPDAYHSLLWQHFINNMRKAAECWNPRAPAGMVRALSAWSAAAPAWLLRHAAAAVAVPRVASAARAWSPTRDTQPLHVWVLPWHAHAPECMSTEVYPVLRARLAAALAAWHPADASARPLLAPWRAAWGPTLTALLHQHIVPKLHLCLQQAPIDVTTGKLEAWSWCADWEELVGAATLAAVAGRSLLPRWLAALAAWLNTGPQHATLITAYTAWKNMFSEDILREPIVKDAFRKALDMMNRSADMGVVAPTRPAPEEPRAIAEIIGSSNQQKSFTELLEARCLERGISLLPMTGRTREGRPLFKIGPTLVCYVMRNVVMYSNDAARTFQPISLEMLLQMAEH